MARLAPVEIWPAESLRTWRPLMPFGADPCSAEPAEAADGPSNLPLRRPGDGEFSLHANLAADRAPGPDVAEMYTRSALGQGWPSLSASARSHGTHSVLG